jgi:hypothetical protein
VEREHGASKMSNTIVMEAFWRVAQWGVAKRLRQLSRVNDQPKRRNDQLKRGSDQRRRR